MNVISRLMAAAAAAALALPMPAAAEHGYIGQIILVPYTYCPHDTLEADGRLLPIRQFSPLFILLGKQFGGDGVQTFGLPDLRGRSAIGVGNATDGSRYDLADTGGAATVKLAPWQLPVQLHPGPGDTAPSQPGAVSGRPTTTLADPQPLSVRDPYVALRYCIFVYGDFPQRP